jgi:2-C-methyl-D-erythritol 2,4-cyclodiphosphate synthase
MRIGQGFDIHPFTPSGEPRPLILGGVRIDDGTPGLTGHSDGDAVAHAVIDSILGAAGLGDIGSWFPDTDPAGAGADSIGLLRQVVAAVEASGWVIGNVDCTVIAERPQIAKYRDEMQAALGGAVGATVTVKGKRAEGLGALGREEGVACLAVALILER